jgi:hypothetical protein
MTRHFGSQILDYLDDETQYSQSLVDDDLIHNALVNNYTTPHVIKEPTRVMSTESDMDYQ